jgi:hypothetical protein
LLMRKINIELTNFFKELFIYNSDVCGLRGPDFSPRHKKFITKAQSSGPI